jgi:hypothetical protein
MGTPSWLYYLFGVLMLAVAGYGSALLLVSVPTRQVSGRDVDIAHIFMGVSMAGMFVAHWAFGPSGFWELVFAILLVWFLVRSLQSIQRFGLHLPHEGIHAAMSFAMLLMYWYPMGSAPGSSMEMAMSASSSATKLDPGLGLLLAMMFFASAIFTLASPVKGASHHGRHSPALAVSGVRGAGEADSAGGEARSIGRAETLVATPWLEDASHVVMCVGMGFMLILML